MDGLPELAARVEAFARRLAAGPRLAQVQVRQAQAIAFADTVPGTLVSSLGLAREAGAVARAIGVRLPFDDPAVHAESVARVTFGNRNSMLQDVEHRRRTEIGAINGAVARLGSQYGVPTPLNATMATLIHALEDEYLTP